MIITMRAGFFSDVAARLDSTTRVRPEAHTLFEIFDVIEGSSAHSRLKPLVFEALGFFLTF